MITILGPTASGKTTIAAKVANILDGEILSADSRQVYRGMNIGTGKDYNEYLVDGRDIPVHLIDIADPGTEYNIYRYQADFLDAYNEILSRKKLPVLCGGSGMYLDAVLNGYALQPAGINLKFRGSLETKSDEALRELIVSLRTPHNTTDLVSRDRMIRAIEVSMAEKTGISNLPFPKIKSSLFGIRYSREMLCKRITERLEKRLAEGMIDEVTSLLDKELTPEQLKFYGLEYRKVIMYLEKELSYEEMFTKLNIAIRQFAKRQMTWFRRMERSGHTITWIDGTLPEEGKIDVIVNKAG